MRQHGFSRMNCSFDDTLIASQIILENRRPDECSSSPPLQSEVLSVPVINEVDSKAVTVVESLGLPREGYRSTIRLSEFIYGSKLTLEIEVTLPFRPNPAITSWHGTSNLHHDGKLPLNLEFFLCTRISLVRRRICEQSALAKNAVRGYIY